MTNAEKNLTERTQQQRPRSRRRKRLTNVGRQALVGAYFLLGLLAVQAVEAGGLKQTAPAKKAPDVINTPDTSIWDAYPWFSNDGKLFLFTREDSATAEADVYASYIDNFDELASAGGSQVPDLDVAEPIALPSAINGVSGQTVKAIAYCEKTPQPTSTNNNKNWRYEFYLFYSQGDGIPVGNKKMYRADKVWVKVKKSTGKMVSTGINGSINEMGANVNVPGKNVTEPMMTRDGQYLFWASNNFVDTIARYIGPVAACTQLNQSTDEYSNLPLNRFKWRDQYTTGVPADKTSRTNYHAVLEKPNGVTALVFEKCYAQQGVPCSTDPNSRYCICTEYYGDIQTTGFDAGAEPDEVVNYVTGPLNGSFRSTHPAIAGPRNPGGTWNLFYMRGKKIWYTKVRVD